MIPVGRPVTVACTSVSPFRLKNWKTSVVGNGPEVLSTFIRLGGSCSTISHVY